MLSFRFTYTTIFINLSLIKIIFFISEILGTYLAIPSNIRACSLIFSSESSVDIIILLMEANSINFSKDEINPYAFKDPASPHIVSTMENISIDFDLIKKQVQTLMDKSDYLFIEGAGGYDCPLDKSRNVSDLIEYINVPLIIVVGIKLGCLSHAILTMKAIEQKNQKIFGWIANIVDSCWTRNYG